MHYHWEQRFHQELQAYNGQPVPAYAFWLAVTSGLLKREIKEADRQHLERQLEAFIMAKEHAGQVTYRGSGKREYPIQELFIENHYQTQNFDVFVLKRGKGDVSMLLKPKNKAEQEEKTLPSSPRLCLRCGTPLPAGSQGRRKYHQECPEP